MEKTTNSRIPFRFKVDSFTDAEFREACSQVVKPEEMTEELLSTLKKYTELHPFEGSPDPEDTNLPEWISKEGLDAILEQWGYVIKLILQQKEAEKNEIFYDAMEDIFYDASDHFLECPLDPFSYHPIIPIALGLGLFLLLVLIFLALRKVWKNRSESVKKSSGP